MPIPDYQTLMLPLLKAAARGESRIPLLVREIADEYALTEEEREARLTYGETVLSSRLHWAKTYLKQAGLVRSTGWGLFTATESGIALLAENPLRIDNRLLSRFKSFRDFQERSSGTELSNDPQTPSGAADIGMPPEETIRRALDQKNSALADELLERMVKVPPSLLERIVVRLLEELGYGGGAKQRGNILGKPADGGVDGVIHQDPLGLERVYVQAKRYSGNYAVSADEIRSFFGSLDRFKAAKGVFVTTSRFTTQAKAEAEQLSKRIVLIDGKRLSELMISHGVGCRIEEQITLKRIDEDFFAENI